eukprot:CAMPEP_0119496436 /NCGR_PEP_ID=MMETSP1344-20130328/19775_1 /TAXON_ID=236787 /ORGANISM="Florenciella parvula, Strain CCMP2471" /LENGTH=53 /DNA_ID=CAMNT_0007532129 /DNA_START=456 /DNA_END=614 /DNA_ORIENTATION=+
MTQQVLDAIYYEEEAKVNATNELHGLVKPNSNSSEGERSIGIDPATRAAAAAA